MTGKPPSRPGPRRIGRASVAVIVILLAVVIALFVGRNIWHAGAVDEPAPELRQNP